MSEGNGSTPSFTNGVLNNYSVTISEANTCRFTATETGGTTTGISNDFEVVAGAFAELQIVVPAATVAGTLFTVTVNAVDDYGNVITMANDEIALTSDDPNAPMPPNQMLVNGTTSFDVTLNTAPRDTTIVATDVTNPAVNPAAGIIAVSALTSGFNAFDPITPVGETIGWIKTKVAGVPVSLDIVTLANGNFQGSVTVELIAANDDSTTACPANAVPLNTVDPTGWMGLQTWTVDFKNATNNRTTMPAFTENNAWRRARILIIDGGQTYCSNDMFAIRPDRLGAVLVQDDTRTTAGTLNTLDVTSVGSTHVHNAGQPFRVAVPALNANGVVTSNYDGSPEPELPLQPAIAGCSGCIPGAFTTGTWGANGTIVTTTATYSEAGAFSTRLIDEHFSDVDLTDGSSIAERYIYSGTFSVGRFVPDHFAVTLNAPRFATGCVAGGFTYTGQTFQFGTKPVIAITAQNAQNQTTTNYSGILWRLTNNSLSGRSYTDAGAPAALDTVVPAALPSTASDPAIADGGNGTGTLTFSTGTAGLDYAHAAPVAPFDSLIDLSINVEDVDGVTVATINGVTAGNPVVFNDIPFDSGNEMRYGRVFINNAVGSELLPLPMQMVAQYYKDGNSGFVVNAGDSCTSITDVVLANFQPYSGSLFTIGDTTETFTQLPAATTPGDFDLSLSAPGASHQGTVDVTANVPMWLQFDWNGDGAYDNDPSSRAAFGIYKGNPHRVYQREVVGSP
ncbi:MAG TPA: DUF6701 domain-containing protein, partial [Gammaproteobacteria bacterium]|nr:DUF6701 domain-containing protein [Gammaproteobacteria bacterium]